MIFWRGWGVLGFLIPMAGGAALAVLGGLLKLEGGVTVSLIGLGIAIGGVAAFFVGRQFNEEAPKQQVAETTAGLRQRYQSLVEAGQFSRGPQFPRPQSMAEAQQQAAQQLAEDQLALAKNLRNRHTLYMIPFQFVGIVAAALGVVIGVVGLVT